MTRMWQIFTFYADADAAAAIHVSKTFSKSLFLLHTSTFHSSSMCCLTRWSQLQNFQNCHPSLKLSCTLFERSNFCPKIQFLGKSKLSTTKKCKSSTFSRVFHPKKSKIFSGNKGWIFGQKMKISNSVLWRDSLVKRLTIDELFKCLLTQSEVSKERLRDLV